MSALWSIFAFLLIVTKNLSSKVYGESAKSKNAQNNGMSNVLKRKQPKQQTQKSRIKGGAGQKDGLPRRSYAQPCLDCHACCISLNLRISTNLGDIKNEEEKANAGNTKSFKEKTKSGK